MENLQDANVNETINEPVIIESENNQVLEETLKSEGLLAPDESLTVSGSKKGKGKNKDKKNVQAEVIPTPVIPVPEEKNETEGEQKNETEDAEEKNETPKKVTNTTALSVTNIKLTVKTEVYSRKALDDKPAKMNPAELIAKKLPDLDADGEHIFSLRKEGSKRIFYTKMKNLTDQGIILN